MAIYKVHNSITATPSEFENLRDALKHASHIASGNGLDALQELERNGEILLDAERLRYWLNQIEIRQRKYGGSFQEVVNKVAEEIETST